MTRQSKLIAAAAALLLITGTALAQPGSMEMNGRGMRTEQNGPNNNGPDNNGGGFLERILPMLHHLDLTSDQADEIRGIVDEARNSIEALREAEEGVSPRDQFKEMFSSSVLSQSEVETLLNSRLESMKDANAVIASAIVDIHNVLTDEQLEMIAEFEPQGMHQGGMDRSAPAHGGHR